MSLRGFVVRVLSGREETVVQSLSRRIQAAGLSGKIPRVLVPYEMISEIRGGKRRVKKRKVYPGYVLIQLEIQETPALAPRQEGANELGGDEDVWYLLRDTPGFGDFVGGKKPQPLDDEEAARMLKMMEDPSRQPIPRIRLNRGDPVKIKEGPFENFDGVVEEVNPEKGIVKVGVAIFGRSTPVELEYWQVETI